MLEALTPESLRDRLGFAADAAGAPSIGSVAQAARTCVNSWRSPARARVTAYLHRQFIAAGFDEELVRSRVAEVIDALIEVGDVTPVRLSGKASLVLSQPQWIRIAAEDFAFLGQQDKDSQPAAVTQGFVRRIAAAYDAADPIDFAAFMGAPGYRRHLARRTSGTGDGTLAEFWSLLSSAVRHDGQPLDASLIRAVVDPPGSNDGRFGRHNQPQLSGRWKATAPDGTWCAVRPGRNPNEWHPILIRVAGAEVTSLDLFDWDEWNWALLARGVANSAPERSSWISGTLSFEHPVPAQFLRGLRLLGVPGKWAWTWHLTDDAHTAFADWRDAEL
jgi:hypothetical protein